MNLLFITILLTVYNIFFIDIDPTYSSTQSKSINQQAVLDKERLDFINRNQKIVVNVTSANLYEEITLPNQNIRGTASGFIYKGTNYVITTTNAISDINSIEVSLYNRQKWPARLVGIDQDTGIAVVEILSQSKEISSTNINNYLSPNQINVGETVYLMGNPLGIGTSFSSGILISPPRTIKNQKGEFIDDVMEISLNLPASWSGSPVFDVNGNILGMYTNLFDWTGTPKFSGYVLTNETLQIIADTLIKKGVVRRPWIGVKVVTLNAYIANVLSLPINEGVIITDVQKNSPANIAGLKGPEREMKIGNRTLPVGSDIIVAVDGEVVDSDKTFQKILMKKGVGAEVFLSVYRDKKIQKIKIKLEEKR